MLRYQPSCWQKHAISMRTKTRVGRNSDSHDQISTADKHNTQSASPAGNDGQETQGLGLRGQPVSQPRKHSVIYGFFLFTLRRSSELYETQTNGRKNDEF
jgi:hypothetical protein